MTSFAIKKLSTNVMTTKPKKEAEDKFSSHIGFIIQNLEILLTRPEDELTKQDDDSNDMFFLAKGDAYVIMKERTGKEH